MSLLKPHKSIGCSALLLLTLVTAVALWHAEQGYESALRQITKSRATTHIEARNSPAAPHPKPLSRAPAQIPSATNESGQGGFEPAEPAGSAADDEGSSSPHDTGHEAGGSIASNYSQIFPLSPPDKPSSAEAERVPSIPATPPVSTRTAAASSPPVASVTPLAPPGPPPPPPTRAVEGGGPPSIEVGPMVPPPVAEAPVPVPTSIPGPATPAPTGADSAASAPAEYWNAWTEEDCSSVGRFFFGCDYVPVLKHGQRYTFVLSISTQALTEALSAVASTSVPAHLSGSQTQTVHLKVVPLLTDGSLKLDANADRVYDMKVTVSKLGLAQTGQAKPDAASGSIPTDPTPSPPAPQIPKGSEPPGLSQPPVGTRSGAAGASSEAPRTYSVAFQSDSKVPLPASLSDQPASRPIAAQVMGSSPPPDALGPGAQPTPPTPGAATPETAVAVTPAAPPPDSSPTPTKDLVSVAQKFSAGNVRIPIWVNQTPMPCAYIILSIWDGALLKPLDSLMVPVQIQTNAAPQGGCKTAYHGDKIVGGFNSLVTLKSSGSATLPVGLHAFTLDSPSAGKGSYAVVALHDGPNPKIYGWQTDSLLTEVFTDPSGLQQLITEARAASVASPTKDKDPENAYANVATVLREKIFSARDDDGPGGADARAAFDALKDLANKTGTNLIVYSRFTGPNGTDLYYAPLRLFSAPGASLFANDVELVQPLPYERSSGESCIGSWTVIGSPAVAKGISDASVTDMDAILKMKAPWIKEMISDPKRLIDYFAGKDAPQTNSLGVPATTGALAAPTETAPLVPLPSSSSAPQAEGLLVLAHHDKARGLWFAPPDLPVVPDSIARQFPVGSVAYLGACSTAGPDAADKLIRRLNKHQVDGMIASAFSVDTDYSIRFGYALMKILDNAYAQHETPTLAELFSKALQATGKDYDNDQLKYRKLLGLEFMLMGNPDLRLCKR